MAYQHAETHHLARLSQRVWSTFAAAASAVVRVLISVSDTNRRMQIVAELSGKTDAELSALGMRREDIVRRVFNDMKDV